MISCPIIYRVEWLCIQSYFSLSNLVSNQFSGLIIFTVKWFCIQSFVLFNDFVCNNFFGQIDVESNIQSYELILNQISNQMIWNEMKCPIKWFEIESNVQSNYLISNKITNQMIFIYSFLNWFQMTKFVPNYLRNDLSAHSLLEKSFAR